MKHLLAVLAIASACSEPAAPPELATWIEGWEKTRVCLLGGRGGNVEQLEAALAIGELEGVTCEAPRALTIVGVDAALAERWQRASDRAVAVARPGDPAERARLVTLIDADVAQLRDAASAAARGADELPPYKLPELPKGAAIEVGGRALDAGELRGDDGGELYGVARRSSARVAFTASPTVKTELRYAEEGAVGLPSGSWDAYTHATEIRISDRPGVRLDARTARAAIDHGPLRMLVLGGPTLSLAMSADDGQTWRIVDYAARLVGLDQDPRTGALDLVLRYRDRLAPETHGYLWALRLAPEDLDAVVRLDRWPEMTYVSSSENPAALMVAACRAGDTTWMASSSHLHRLRAREAWPMELPTGTFSTLVQAACDREVAVLLRREPASVERCIAGGCAPVLELEHARRGAVAIDERGRWLYAAAAGRVVGIWREGERPVFYRLPEAGEVHALPLFGRTRQLVLSTDAGYRFIALPAEVPRG